MIDARLDRLDAIMGNDFAANAIPIEADRDGLFLSGFAGLPTAIGETRPTSTFL